VNWDILCLFVVFAIWTNKHRFKKKALKWLSVCKVKIRGTNLIYMIYMFDL